MTLRSALLATLLFHLLLAACATSPLPSIEPGAEPALETDEAGLWMFMDRVEQALKTSGRIETDPELNQYVREIICRLSPEYCTDLRFYIVETPHFNAAMAPNGFMQVWTGLLLRAQNEAQLAYVLGHEIGHYKQRHSVQQWRVVRNTSSALAFVQLATSAAGYGYTGEIAQFVVLAGILGYSRDMERESDEIGIALMAEAGYDPREAAQIWKILEAEREAADKDDAFIFFATHPSTKERTRTLATRADQLVRQRGVGERRMGAYIDATSTFRAAWLRDEVRKRSFAASKVVLEHLADGGGNLAEIRYFQGELYRLRAQKGDLEKALAFYAQAVRFDDAPPVTYREIGLVNWKLGNEAQAREALRAYLAKSPQASDHEMIRAYLRELE